MSDQDLDYEAIRANVNQKLPRQKWLYRIIFFVMHVIFFVISMLFIWRMLVNDERLRELLIYDGSGAGAIVLVPVILWAAVLLFHVASLYIESRAGEKAMREKLLMREIRDDILRRKLVDEGMLEKPKRRDARSEERMALLSDDGELLPADEDPRLEPDAYKTHANHAGSS